MFHTRDIIKEVSYKDLVISGIIPDIVQCINVPTKKYPPFVYGAKDFSYFGMFMYFVVRAGLRINLTDRIFDLGIHNNFTDVNDQTILDKIIKYNTTKNMNDVASTSLSLTSFMYNKNSYSAQDIQKYVPTIV